ncbi:MAG: hypothetical protein HN368_21080, partial [Spirochaetales bacterium]|nr:hypothetical protein [Spirochaetales bacterium]
MNKKVVFLCATSLFIAAVFTHADVNFSTNVAGGLNFPLASESDTYDTGTGLALQGIFTLARWPQILAAAEAGYDYAPLNMAAGAPSLSLSLVSAAGVFGYRLLNSPRLNLSVFGKAGGFLGFMTDTPAESDWNPLLGGGIALAYTLLPNFQLGAEYSYRNFLGLYSDTRLSLTARFLLSSAGTTPVPAGPSQLDPEPLDGDGGKLEIINIEFDNIFPVFFKFYDSNPIGTLRIRNSGSEAVRNIKADFFVNQYMDNPK